MEKGKHIKDKNKKIIGLGIILGLIGILVSYSLYNAIKENTILELTLKIEIFIGMFYIGFVFFIILFRHAYTDFLKNTIIINAVWLISIGICLMTGLFIVYNSIKRITIEQVCTLSEEESVFKSRREQIQLDALDVIESKITDTDKDASWHCVKEELYLSNGVIIQVINYDYDKRRLIKKVFSSGNGQIEKYVDYIYNNRGNLIMTEVYIPNDNTSKDNLEYKYDPTDKENIIYEYDSEDRCVFKRIITNTSIIPDNEANSYEVYTYDEEGKLVKTEEYNKGELLYIHEYNYDQEGKIEKVINTYMDDRKANNITEESYHYEFDNDGNLIKQEAGDYITYYDADGNTVKEERWDGQILESYSKYTYEFF